MTVGLGEYAVGRITHYYPRIQVGIVELTSGAIHVGDVIHIQGKRTNLVQSVDSMQLDHRSIGEADSGRKIGIKVNGRVRQHDQVGVATWVLRGL
jgi:translation elongation factor EF-Tu-like GTPase